MVKFNFDYKGREVNLDVEECRNLFQKARGLMFRKKSKPLLFFFKSEKRRAIHSFFCMPFYAVWFGNGKVIDGKTVDSWKFSIRPKESFNLLLEIPESDSNFRKFADDTERFKKKSNLG